MSHIAYFTELSLQICDYAQKRRICRENVNTRLTKIFMPIFAPDERLPSSATLGLAVSWNVGHSPENVHALVNSKLSHNLKSSPIICTMESSRIKFLRYSIFESTILIFIKDAWAVSTEQGNFSFRLTKVPKLLGSRILFVLCCHPPWLGFTLSNTKYIFALRFANSNSNFKFKFKFKFLGLEQEKVCAQPSTLTYVDMLVFKNWCTSMSNYVLAHLE